MLEEKLNDIILLAEQQIKLVKIKLKSNKTELKQLEKISNNKYLDNEKIQIDLKRLKKEIIEIETRLRKLKKVLYRLKVCERILNNEEE